VNPPSIPELEKLSRLIRFKLVEMSHASGAPHLGSSLSCVDILVAAYWGVLRIDPHQPNNPSRDRFILSKGHAATTLYATLAHRGYFGMELLDTFGKFGSALPEHPRPGCVPGVELATGSLGHGLPVGLGMALAARIQQLDYRVFVNMSDGECNEGTVWEAALLAPAQRVEKLTVIIDFNKWQATGRSCEVMSLNPLKAKWEAFGWSAIEVDGHDISALIQALSQNQNGTGKPLAIVAHTIKGKGVSFMQDDNNWHYRIPKQEEVVQAGKELGIL
jgi:transketolase